MTILPSRGVGRHDFGRHDFDRILDCVAKSPDQEAKCPTTGYVPKERKAQRRSKGQTEEAKDT